MTKVYSLNGQDYKTWDELMREIAEDPDTENGEFVTIWEGDQKPWKHEDFISGDSIIENIQEGAYGEGREYSEEYLADIGNEELIELEKLVSEWLDKKAEQPAFYAVENEREIVIEAEIDDD